MKTQKKQAPMTAVADADPVCLKIKRKVRLILWGGEPGKKGHNNAFQAAAQTLKKDYEARNEKGCAYEIKMAEVKKASDIVDEVDKCDANQIYSLDIFTHATPAALHMNTAPLDAPPEIRKKHNVSLYQNLDLMIGNNSNWITGGASRIWKIKFSNFTENAKIELHGCRSGGDPNDDKKPLKERYYENNIAADLSVELYKAGKIKAYVIGHRDKGSPNIEPGNKNIQDYRHGVRMVFHNKKLIHTTSVKRHLDEKSYQELASRQGASK